MATIYIDFQPDKSRVFTFLGTFDGVSYNVTVPWNYYGQRYYIQVFTIQGQLVLCMPLIDSPDGGDIDLLAGYFDTKMVFRSSDSRFEIT